MTHAKNRLRQLASLAIILASGCASAYDNYSGCHIDCNYCVPAPLQHTQYDNCACHSAAVSKYLAAPQEYNQPATADVANGEFSTQ